MSNSSSPTPTRRVQLLLLLLLPVLGFVDGVWLVVSMLILGDVAGVAVAVFGASKSR